MTNRLRDALEGKVQAQVIDAKQTAQRDETRDRIRAKLCETDRNFIDKLRETFPSARLVGIKFNDGETIGRI
jgi:hypothetical protein